ncbi:sensor histidine kinase [Luethyella okanaganae]|uniref:histidine kinase n=1 Tax=Luethyella okanaganae TaxID=69372 RepID=A0ABW1V9A9_9MICO
MESRRWWDAAFAAVIVFLSMFVLVHDPPLDASEAGALATLGALGLAYYSFGRYRLWSEPTARNVVFSALLIATVSIGSYFDPMLAILQAVVYPCLWVIALSTRMAIVTNSLAALGVFVASTIRGGMEAIAPGLVAAGLSLVFSISLGLWITSIERYGSERAKLLEELVAVQDELAALHRDSGVASERERLAREIHDTIAQNLTSLVMLAQRARTELAAVPGTTATEGSLDLIETTARDALTEARTLVVSMSSVTVGDSTLTDTVERLAERFQRETGILVTPRVAATGLDRDVEVVLLRCAQEGLANVRKHSRAEAASVLIEHRGSEIALVVSDDGRGLGDYEPGRETGFGLSGMRDRVGLVGGTLTVGPGTDRGAVLTVLVPAHSSSGVAP